MLSSVLPSNAVKQAELTPAVASSLASQIPSQSGRRVKTHKPIAIDFLMRLPTLAGLTIAQAIALSEGAAKKTFKNNEVLVQTGQMSDKVFIILSGRANVILGIRQDKELAIASLGAGDCVGEMAALDQKPHCTNVVADGPLHALMLHQQSFLSVLHQNHQVANTLLNAMLRHMVRANRQVMWLTNISVQGRVARTLMDLAVPNEHGHLYIKTKITSVALAKRVGASREMVGKALKGFESKGFIQKTPAGGLRINDKRKNPRH
jgi:CRP/FNR family cyclic AMP-dependent transcriptional regulator